jgi:hypothetical protein
VLVPRAGQTKSVVSPRVRVIGARKGGTPLQGGTQTQLAGGTLTSRFRITEQAAEWLAGTKTPYYFLKTQIV